ncbi:MAG: hypothetical protein LBV63_04250 [Candidatus Methanoplasma sp.]|jgi:hypothetical protein|nr:hypothetical protein [Candidatus Methanoplasma sp.]
MTLDTIMQNILSRGGVKWAFPIEREFWLTVSEEENGIGTVSGMPMENRALAECRKRDTAICMFCNGVFEESHGGHVMIMEDNSGNVVGHDVPADMMDQFRNDPEAFWLCEDFVMFPNRALAGDIKMVMLPKPVVSLNETHGAKDPILLYPATTTDLLLKRHFGIATDDHRLSSAILAFDLVP